MYFFFACSKVCKSSKFRHCFFFSLAVRICVILILVLGRFVYNFKYYIYYINTHLFSTRDYRLVWCFIDMPDAVQTKRYSQAEHIRT